MHLYRAIDADVNYLELSRVKLVLTANFVCDQVKRLPVTARLRHARLKHVQVYHFVGDCHHDRVGMLNVLARDTNPEVPIVIGRKTSRLKGGTAIHFKNYFLGIRQVPLHEWLGLGQICVRGAKDIRR
jgi:hypothetical protein